MIYLVSYNKLLFESEFYKVITVEESFSIMESWTEVGLDTETEGLDPYTKSLLSVQFGNYEDQIVIDCLSVNITQYKDFLLSNRLFLFWNAKFDLKFLLHHHLLVTNVYDGFLAEKLFYMGYPTGFHSMSLKDAGINYLNIELDKSVRGSIVTQGLTERVIIYAANDVKYLGKIREKQLDKLTEKDLLRAIDVENKFVPICAYFEYCGAKIDPVKWRNKVSNDTQDLNSALIELNTWVETNFPNSKWLSINTQGNLFDGFNTKPQCNINWNSTKQVAPFFKELGINCTIIDAKTGKSKISIDERVIKPQSTISPVISLFLNYKGKSTQVETFGNKFLNLLNPVTHRIHCNFNQLGTNTGRLSSTDPNLQNLPSDEITRACFVAEDGNSWLSADYKGQESFLMASIANDTAMLEELTTGSKDMHSLTAKMVFPEIPRDFPVDQIKDKFHDLRKKAKGYEFLWNYGGGVSTLEKNFGLPHEEAERLDIAYRKGFSGLANYQAFRRKEVLRLGYILLSPLTGHKTYIYDYEDWKAQLDRQKQPGFWDYYRKMKEDAPECDTVQAVKHLAKRRAESEKQSINYPIQAAGALTFKIACIKLYNWILEHNLLFTIKFCIPAHDEINLECPQEIADEVGKVLIDCMERAGDIFCTRAKLTADLAVSDHWIH